MDTSTVADFGRLLRGLVQPAALIELAVLATCLGVAWLAVGGLRMLVHGRAQPLPGWGIFAGVLYPLVALLLAVAGRALLAAYVPVAVFQLVIPLLVALLAIRITVCALRAAFPGSQLMHAVERTFSWLAWGAAALWITGILPAALGALDAIQWQIGGNRISVRRLLEGTVTAVSVLLMALWVSALLEARLLRGATHHLTVRRMAANALRAFLLFVGVMAALSAAGIDPTALGVLGGALGVGIGFGLQRLAANYVSGFVILAERSSRIGDVVRVDGFEGRITDINTRYTVIRAANGRVSIVPNEMMTTQRVENASSVDSASSTVIRIAYGPDFDALFLKLAEAVGKVDGVLQKPLPAVRLSALGVDGAEVAIDYSTGVERARIASDVNRAVLRVLQSEGIEINGRHPGASTRRDGEATKLRAT